MRYWGGMEKTIDEADFSVYNIGIQDSRPTQDAGRHTGSAIEVVITSLTRKNLRDWLFRPPFSP